MQGCYTGVIPGQTGENNSCRLPSLLSNIHMSLTIPRDVHSTLTIIQKGTSTKMYKQFGLRQ